jgi:uncharacterized protein YcbX
MAAIQSLHIYPVKGCGGIALDSATLGPAGLRSQGVGDREWMLVDADTGLFVTQRQLPRMALVRPLVDAGVLRLSAPGQATLEVALQSPAPHTPGLKVKVWNHECLAFDEGDQAAAWFSAFLGRPLRLVRFDPAHRRISSTEWTGAVEALNLFSDGYPILLISQASLDDLNDKLTRAGRQALPMNRFRPNIVLADVGPYEEDYLESLQAGGITFKPVKPCPRCPVPSIEQSTGEFGPDPLDILSQYRSDELTGGVIFGQNLIALEGVGLTVTVGQEFAAEWNF